MLRDVRGTTSCFGLSLSMSPAWSWIKASKRFKKNFWPSCMRAMRVLTCIALNMGHFMGVDSRKISLDNLWSRSVSATEDSQDNSNITL